MNFDFSEDQHALREQVRKFMLGQSPVSAARQVIDQGLSHAKAVWDGLQTIGATALMLPEDCGGAGLDALELCVVAEEAGRQLAAVPLASTLYCVTQSLLLGASPVMQKTWLSRIAQGEIACMGAPLDPQSRSPSLPRFDGHSLTGTLPLVADGGSAEFAVVLACAHDGTPVWVVADLGPQVQRSALHTLDPSKPYCRLEFAQAPAQALDAGVHWESLLVRVRHRAAILLAFEQLGGADAALEMAAHYARERKAFGRAIGSYQGIKHKLADMYTANQLARVHCYYGAWALDADARSGADGDSALGIAAAAARVSATQAYSLAAQENLQTHGGMGYTWDSDCHLHYRRARHHALVLGSVHHWREQLSSHLCTQFRSVATQRKD
jgi:alkylation response protein AidB-like acyl-CoA dehydrogenase